MADHQPQALDEEPHETLASAASDTPSLQPLVADPNPNGASPSSSDSSLWSDSSSDRHRKRTRFCPNLSDCHSCGAHINNTNPQDRLQTLDSVWRIVLLCKKCIKRVKSGQSCSYCFAETGGGECFQCRDCHRRIHKDCVLRHGCSAPWSYCRLESGFSVCVDCWVPKLLANSNGACRRRRNRKIVSEGESRVLVGNGIGGPKSLEDVANDANCAAEKKVMAATKAKEEALRKTVVAKRAVDLANAALDLVSNKDESGVKNEGMVSSTSSSATNTTTAPVVDDAALAFELHRAMNSSPRISRNLGSCNSNCKIPKIRDSNGDLTARLSDSKVNCGKVAVCTTSIKFAENLDGTVSEPSVCNKASDDGSRTDLNDSKLGGMTDARMISESRICQKQEELGHELHSSTSRTDCRFKCNGNGILLYARRRKKTPDRYSIKYRKRPVGSKAVSNRETKFLYDCFHLQSKVMTSGPTTNCFDESRTFSDASFQSCAVAVQASPCGTDSSQHHS